MKSKVSPVISIEIGGRAAAKD